MDVIFRTPGPEDAEAMAAIGRRTFTETFGHLYSEENLDAFLENHREEKWRAELANPSFSVQLGEAGGVPAAYVKLGPPSVPFQIERPAIEIRQFYVLKPWQGAGIAARMMEWALGEAKARGVEEIYLSVFTDNNRARRFYARYGFEEVGAYHFMVGTHADDELIARLKLGEAA